MHNKYHYQRGKHSGLNLPKLFYCRITQQILKNDALRFGFNSQSPKQPDMHPIYIPIKLVNEN